MSYSFNAIEVRDKAVAWIKKQAEEAHFSKVVIGISGGKDSTIAAALCCRALGKENVHGLLMPNGVQADINDSYEVCKALGIKHTVINIQPIYQAYLLQYGFATAEKDMMETGRTGDHGQIDPFGDIENNITTTEQAKINLAPRIRMSMLRFYGQSNKCRLCGTGNLSEIILGYYTKDGDNRSDFNPLGGMTSIEVVEVGKTMEEIPEHLVVKAPADGLTGKTDEDNLGIKYEDVHKYARNLELDKDTWYKIHAMELANLHKRSIPVFDPMYKEVTSK